MDKLRIGVIGVGGRGNLANHWADNRRSAVVGGADVSMEALADFRQRVGQEAFVTLDYRELLERDDIDAVAVTSPDFMHEEHAVAALEAGKHVFCEKPLAITVRGCDRILRTWQESGKHLMVGFNMRYMSIFRTMKEIVDSGVIGAIKAVWVRHFVGYGGDFYYHDWHGTRDNTTSLLLQKGSHDIDMIHWITGRYTQRVAAFGSLDFYGGDKPDSLTCPDCDINDTCTEALFGTRTQCAFRREIDVEDNQVMIMELEGGIKASYLQCHFTPDYHRNYVFIGTEGRVENSEPEMKVWVKTRRSNSYRELADRAYDVKPSSGTHGGADPVICEDFLDMVLDGKQPVATPEAGRMSVAAGCAGAMSIRSGGAPVDVSPLPPRAAVRNRSALDFRTSKAVQQAGSSVICDELCEVTVDLESVAKRLDANEKLKVKYRASTPDDEGSIAWKVRFDRLLDVDIDRKMLYVAFENNSVIWVKAEEAIEVQPDDGTYG